MDLLSASTYVKKVLRKKGSGEEVGMAFVKIEEVKTRVRRVGVFDFGTGRVGYLQKSSGTGTGRDG